MDEKDFEIWNDMAGQVEEVMDTYLELTDDLLHHVPRRFTAFLGGDTFWETTLSPRKKSVSPLLSIDC